MRRAADLALAALFIGVAAARLMAEALRSRLGPSGRKDRHVVYLGTGRIAQVFPRNGVNLFLERECSDFGGFFDALWNVHFPAGGRGALDLTPRHHLVDFDVEPPGLLRFLPRAAIAYREACFLAWLARQARSWQASVLTATNPHLQGLNAMLLGWALGLPYGVIITRDFDWDWEHLGKQAAPSIFPSRKAEKWIERLVLRRASLVLADRAYYRAFAIRNGAAPDRAVATRVLADNAYACATPLSHEELGLPPGPLLVYVGRLDPDKFPLDLVGCLAAVRRRFPSAQLACAGTGSLADAMRDAAHAAGCADALHLLGSVSLERLPSLLATADVVVAAHMGYTLVEAGLAGAPIATYDYDFHGEIVQDGVTGYLAPFRAVDRLADLVCAALADRGEARRRGQALRERLLAEHSVAAVTPLYQAAYARALGDRRRSPVASA